ncbi:hypothetical protein OE749_05270 [Aestuariibacter sp. AA17]|uniref:Uncharacterized protein n=1 Tax=Fluctibacter corallii TaxID=2984329 RepID=A0ABT3A5Y5_9ALTE|nr:hypothetical protein [Aestuariibacter sp. AA17]MCV2884095.1 hypothetical protein [Aestuariibacter sp. AA17]
MNESRFVLTNEICTTQHYSNDKDRYRGNIVCLECEAKAWFIKGYDTDKMSRKACFAAHHKEGCEASTVGLEADDVLDGNGETTDSPSTDIYINLDNSKEHSLYVSEDNSKFDDEPSEWTKGSKCALGNSSGYPLKKSLRQLLTNLCRNPEYKDQDREIKIVAENGRIVLEGQLKEKVVHLTEINQSHTSNVWVFWGPINNLYKRKNGELWLNFGNSHEPSVVLDRGLDTAVINNFKIKDVGELDGSEILVIGPVGFRGNQAIIKPAFTKYMTFRRHRVKE